MTKLMVILAVISITVVLLGLAGCSSAAKPPTPDPDSIPPIEVEPEPKPPTPDPESVPPIEVGPQVGKLAPDFTFMDSNGEKVSLSDMRGKSIMLNFWATWCGPCKYEMSLIQDLANDQEKAEKGLILLTVNDGESADTVGRFMKEHSYSFPVLLDIQKAIVRSYNVRAIPTTFFIGQDGIIREIKVGAFTSESDLEKILDTFIE